jgi:hypothetical protein
MNRKTRQRVIQAFAIIAIIGMVFSSMASAFFYLF